MSLAQAVNVPATATFARIVRVATKSESRIPARGVSGAFASLAERPTLTAWMGATLCALILAFNVFRLPFLWDDFDFLGRAQSLQLKHFLPDPSIVFYRPLSREAHFWVVTHILNSSPLAAHVLNAAIAAGTLAILIAFVRNLVGAPAGLLAGLVFACSAVLPLEIGWVSAGQDLLCAFFLMAALYLQLLRKPLVASLAMAAALLSKETAIVILPIVVVLSAIRPDRSKGELIRTLVAQGAVALGWAAIHPWIRSLLSGATAGESAASEYLAFRGVELLPAMLRGAAITLNLPWAGQTPAWPSHLIPPAIVVTAVLLLIARMKPVRLSTRAIMEGGHRVAILVGSLMLLGSLALTSLLLGLWSPHYACIPALGLSIVAGPLLARAPVAISAATLVAYLWLGIGLRGNAFEPIVPSEPNFIESAAALQKVEAGFKSLYPTLPASNVYVSVQAQGSGGLYRQVFRFQPLRIWYREPDIWVLDPNRRKQGQAREFLFWIDRNLAVWEIQLTDFRPRGPTGDISLPQYQKTLRGYAFGLASAGDVDRAVFILAGMPQQSRVLWAFDRRSAAMLLYAAARPAEAERVAATAPQFAPDRAMEAVVALLVEPVSGLDLDTSAMRAFGLDPGDEQTVRSLMRTFEARNYFQAAIRFATRLQAMRPGEPESAAVLERLRKHDPRGITVPIPYDIPQ